MISRNTEKVIYTEAIIDDDTLGLAGVRINHKPEIEAAQQFHAQILSYPEALAEVFHTFPMKIAVAGAHGTYYECHDRHFSSRFGGARYDDYRHSA